MSINQEYKPRLPNHYQTLFLPPDEKGDEVLHFISDSRRIKLKGHSFREFQRDLLPLLDGKRTLAEIKGEVADVFAPEDVDACLDLLIQHNLVEDAGPSTLSSDDQEHMAPQLNFLHEITGESHKTQEELAQKVVAVVGLSGAGATAAAALAVVGIGTIIGIDPEKAGLPDSYLSSVFTKNDAGTARTEIVRRRLEELAPSTKFVPVDGPLDTEDDIQNAVAAADLVICTLDAGRSSSIYKLNRVCLAAKKSWLSCETAGAEVRVGPLMTPGETACFLCYKMRLVASTDKPEDEFAFQRLFDRRKHDDSGSRENLVFGTNIAGQLAALEAIKFFIGPLPKSTKGRIAIVDLLDLTVTKHLVLQKPWCPACHTQVEMPNGEIDERTAAAASD